MPCVSVAGLSLYLSRGKQRSPRCLQTRDTLRFAVGGPEARQSLSGKKTPLGRQPQEPRGVNKAARRLREKRDGSHYRHLAARSMPVGSLRVTWLVEIGEPRAKV